MNLYRVLSFFAICFLLFSCSAEYFLQKGDKIYETGRFYKSCDYYKEAYAKIKSKDSKTVVAQKIGEAYERINKLREASLWYNKSLSNDDNNTELISKIIDIAHKRGDVKLIEKYVSSYESLVGDNPKVLKYYMDNFSNSNGRYRYELFKNINTGYNDFSPVYEVGDTNVVYFTSTRRIIEKRSFISKIFGGKGKRDVVTGTPYSNLFKMEYSDQVKYKDNKGKEKIRRLKKPKWTRGTMLCDTSINSTYNEGAACFSPDGKKMYFTSSRKTGNIHTGTKIYTAEKTKDSWGNVKILNIVPDSVSIGHPAISPDGARLYFVSDMEYGQGGRDIWYTEKSGGKWGQPVNAGETINTRGDEMFPFFRDNGELYFSSTGHSGFGGLDIFKVVEKDGDKHVVNIGFPFNSEADDFGIVYKKGFDEGLFSSSRGKRGVDNIYKFRYTPYINTLRIKTGNELTGAVVSDVNIKIVSELGEDRFLNTGTNGEVSVVLKENNNYLFVVYREGYLKEKFEISIRGLTGSKNLEKIITLKPIEKPIELPNILYDFGKWDLKNESKKALDGLVNVLNNNPNIVIELSSHTDMVGSEEDNMVLSQNRAQSVVDYLIEKGVYWDRLVAKGYGESQPKEITIKDEKRYSFFNSGDVLTKKYIDSLDKEKREYANQLNRRTEFRVLKTDYKPRPDSKNIPEKKIFSQETGSRNNLVKNDLGKAFLIKDLIKVKGMFFTLQLGVLRKSRIPEKYKALKVVFFYPISGSSSGIITYGIFDTYKQAKENQKKVKLSGFDCFISAYKDGKRIELKEAIKLAEKSN